MGSLKKDGLIIFAAFFSLFAAIAIDTISPVQYEVDTLYAVPILIVAYRLRSKWIAVFSSLAIITFSTEQAYMDHLPFFNIFLKDLVFIIVAMLAFQFNNQRQKANAHRKEAEAAREQLQLFMNAISHDLLQPITVVKLYAHMLLNNPQKNTGRTVEKLYSSLDHLERLILDLRDTAHIRSGKFALQPVKMDLVKLAHAVIEQQQQNTMNHTLKLDAPKTLKGTWDKDRLHQVLTNLIINAIKYAPNGGVITVTLKKNACAQIFVADHGIGMTENQISQLFKPFARQHNNRKIGGTGLGLYICKSIIQGHQGKLWATSKRGKGSIFHIELPLYYQKGKKNNH
jgi:signal transduction histidine kinase